jgi:hypothetical protein
LRWTSHRNYGRSQPGRGRANRSTGGEETGPGGPEGHGIGLVAAQAIADDLGATDGAAVLAKQVERSPFNAVLTEIEKAQRISLTSGATRLASIQTPLAPSEIRQRHHLVRAWYLPTPSVLSVIGAVYISWAKPHREGPLPDDLPPLRQATDDLVDATFSKDAPERQGVAVRLGDGDKMALDRALFNMQLPFHALGIAILSRDDGVVDRVGHPVPNQV